MPLNQQAPCRVDTMSNEAISTPPTGILRFSCILGRVDSAPTGAETTIHSIPAVVTDHEHGVVTSVVDKHGRPMM